MVGVVILNYNNSNLTLGCLESLYRCCPDARFKVCVVDNASSPEALSLLEKGLTRGEALVKSPVNCGYARGNNLGCEWFENDPEVDKILILNDDCLFCEDILSPLSAYLDAYPDCGVVFPLVKGPEGNVDAACLRRAKSNADLFLQAGFLGRFTSLRGEFIDADGVEGLDCAIHTGVPPGSCMMLPKEYFRSIGYLDPNTFLYFEEHILAAKLNRDGRSCVLLPAYKIIHLGAQTTKKQSSKAIYRHWRNSYLYFLKAWSSMPLPLRLWLRFRTALTLALKR